MDLRETQDNIYLLKVKNGNSRKSCERCSILPIKTTERRHNGNTKKGVKYVQC